eukprot:UN03752
MTICKIGKTRKKQSTGDGWFNSSISSSSINKFKRCIVAITLYIAHKIADNGNGFSSPNLSFKSVQIVFNNNLFSSDGVCKKWHNTC